MKNRNITIIGGSGFVGSHIVRMLAKSNDVLKIVCRDQEAARFLKIFGAVGQIAVVQGNIDNEKQIEEFLNNSDIVINLVGILFEKDKDDFYNIHAKAASDIAKVCKNLGVKKLIHFSALGIDENQSKYAKTKKQGELEIFQHFPDALIIRPSVIFGKEDNFINKFRKMADVSPFLPLIGGGKTLFQPVHVIDVAKLVSSLINASRLKGKIIEVAGPKIYSFKELLEFILKASNKKRYFLNVNNSIARLIGKICNKLMSNPLITDDQVLSLQYDNVMTNNQAMNFSDFDIEPKSLEDAIEF